MYCQRMSSTILASPVNVAYQPTLSTTSEFINNFFATAQATYAQPSYRNSILSHAKYEMEIEYKLIENVSTCGVPKIEALADRLGGLNPVKMKNLMSTELQNPEALHSIMCVTDSILYTSPYDSISDFSNNRIRDYFSNLRVIGNDSSDGVAILADFDGVQDMMIIKAAKDAAKDALLHEGIVGIYGTNNLRKLVPNYAYIYGGFKCSPPLIDSSTREVITWCLHNENTVNYVLYENVDNSVTFRDYIKDCSVQEFLEMYMQILYAEREALIQLDFTHYDLHDENVVIRDVTNAIDYEMTINKLKQNVNNSPNGLQTEGNKAGSNDNSKPKINDKRFQIAYNTERGREYITTTKVATIIDYGYSHFKLPETYNVAAGIVNQETHIGASGLSEYSIFPQRSWIMHDLYKLLMFCARFASMYGNDPVYREIEKIFRFFNTQEKLSDAINLQWPIRYSLPLTEKTVMAYTIDKYAQFIRHNSNCEFIGTMRNISMPSLSCDNMCVSENGIYDELGMSLTSTEIPAPDNIILFYELNMRLYNKGRNEERDVMIAKFDYKKAMSTHIEKMKQYMTEIYKLSSNFRSVDMQRLGLNTLFNQQTLASSQNAYFVGSSIIDRTQRLKYFYAVGIAVASRYEDKEGMNQLNAILNEYNSKIRPVIVSTHLIIVNNNTYLESIMKNPSVIQIIEREPVYRWYWTDRRYYDAVIGQTAIYRDDINLL